jgi:hypothetical protein
LEDKVERGTGFRSQERSWVFETHQTDPAGKAVWVHSRKRVRRARRASGSLMILLFEVKMVS